MAPKKRKSGQTKANNKTAKISAKTQENGSNEEIAEYFNNGLNNQASGLRRSTRVSKAKPNKTNGKSKYFGESDDNESDDSLVNDEEFKPEVKAKQSIVKPKKTVEVKKHSDSSSDDGEDWEEVMDINEQPLDDYKPDIPTEGVQIMLNETAVKKKKSTDINDLIRQRINRFKRDLQSDRHKTSLLLYISRAIFLNDVANNALIKAISLSLTVNEFKAPKRLTSKFLNEFINWFNNNFKFKDTGLNDKELIINSLVECFRDRKAQNSVHFNLMFLSLLRSLGKFTTRLCVALNPVDLKPKDLMLSQKQMEARTKLKPSSNKTKDLKKESKKRKIVSSDSEDEYIEELQNESQTKTKLENKKYLETWVEVYVDSDRKWICLDLSNNIVDKPLDIASKSLPHLSYVIGVDSDGYVKEVTQRYITDWMSPAMKRRRIDQKWWTQTLGPFQMKNKNAADKAEESEFDKKMSSTPLPTKISEYKNHPLYVLKKDLLKFQGIYPSDAPSLGFIRNEPVYARECVQLLRSRETWLRFARTVRVGETPYKVVKSRPKWDKYAKNWRRDLPLELFGEWQTEPYDPPEAKDGKVPRNGYGNIDLFQPCMLPKGCVHLRLPGLARVANKLKIDCVPAIIAFDNNNGGHGSHPVMDGFVVCKEFEEVLIAAWEEEQEIAQQRQIEKREKRIYDNWRKLIKGLLIREKVRKKYENNEEDSDETDIEGDN